MKIMSNYTTSTTKLIGHDGNQGMIQWRAGSSQQEIRKSCEDAKCAFLHGGVYIDPETGKTISKKSITITNGTISTDPVYRTRDGKQAMKVDKCFSIFGTPYLSAYAWDIKYPERLGMEGLKRAISQAPRSADRARGALVGNASTILSPGEMSEVDETIRKAVPFHILYDHAWRRNPWILKYAVASCNHIQDTKDAIKAGATVCSIVLPQNLIDQYKGRKIGDHKFVQCPENLGRGTNCINCGGSKRGPLCDAQARSNLIVMFRQHGNNSWERSKKSTIRNIAKASTPAQPNGDKFDKMRHKAAIGRTLEEFEAAIRKGDRKAIISIGKKALKNVSKATAKRYRQFLELPCE